jgi:hypothetical protein
MSQNRTSLHQTLSPAPQAAKNASRTCVRNQCRTTQLFPQVLRRFVQWSSAGRARRHRRPRRSMQIDPLSRRGYRVVSDRASDTPVNHSLWRVLHRPYGSCPEGDQHRSTGSVKARLRRRSPPYQECRMGPDRNDLGKYSTHRPFSCRDPETWRRKPSLERAYSLTSPRRIRHGRPAAVAKVEMRSCSSVGFG